MLAGFAALNVGFTNQENEIKAAEVAQVREVDILPTSASPAINETETENLNAYINNTGTAEISSINVETPAVEEETIQPLYYDDYGLDYVAVMEMEATAYLPTDGDGYGITATGIPATYGVAAVDPYVIPLGSRLYIPGYGEAIAADTGGAIYGNRIDLCMESYSECMNFGRRYVTVYVLR